MGPTVQVELTFNGGEDNALDIHYDHMFSLLVPLEAENATKYLTVA